MQINANQCAYKSDINTNTQEFQFGTLNLRPQHFHSHSIHKSVQRGNSLIQNYRIYESVTPPHNTMQQFHSKQTSSEYNEQTEIQTGNSTNIHNTYSFSPLGTWTFLVSRGINPLFAEVWLQPPSFWPDGIGFFPNASAVPSTALWAEYRTRSRYGEDSSFQWRDPWSLFSPEGLSGFEPQDPLRPINKNSLTCTFLCWCTLPAKNRPAARDSILLAFAVLPNHGLPPGI